MIADLCHRTRRSSASSRRCAGRRRPHRISRLAELPIFEYYTSDVSRSTMMLKRALDLIVGVPLALIVAPLVPGDRARDLARGPRAGPLRAATRAGLHGTPFRLLKFRTMHVGADRSLEDLLDELPEPMFKFRSDPRVTRVGRVLRRLSLDELPQIWNLIRGDMSLVGPRPEQLELVERYSPEHRFRLGRQARTHRADAGARTRVSSPSMSGSRSSSTTSRTSRSGAICESSRSPRSR